MTAPKPKSVNRVKSGHSNFWKELSWRCGDTHANRICKLVDIYCALFGLERERFYRSVPRG
jgi:hypothetical protein